MRHVDEQGQVHDVVGDLVLADEAHVVLLPAGRGPVDVPRDAIRAMKKVPPRMVRPTSKVDDMTRLLARTWPGLEQVRMGGWSLVAGRGATGRANSAYSTGDPERDLDEAVQGVVGWYRSRGLRPAVQVAARKWAGDEPGARLDAHLAGLGWGILPETVVMTLDLAADVRAEPAGEMEWADAPTAEWTALQAHGETWLAEAVAAPAGYGLLRDEAHTAIAAGRLATVDDWVVLSCLVVDPERRGSGHGRALTNGMLARARALGSHFAALQVEADNLAALRLYGSLGFVEHHRYRYRVPAGSIS